MSNGSPKYVPPSITETAFNCPRCGALAKQTWFALQAAALDKDSLPLRITEEQLLEKDLFKDIKDKEERAIAEIKARRAARGTPIIDRGANRYTHHDVLNVNVSQCFNCNEIALWTSASMAWPVQNNAPAPNQDLPEEVRLDFEEAGRIVQLSPRGAAALLRLAIQKLCKELGGAGKSIDNDIAALVKDGLNVRIQQALDIVRVIGNEAVHPGTIDLRDDIQTATKLFDLVNIIAETMISQPKHIEALYNGLPPNKLAGIEARDKPRLSAPEKVEGE
jgi:Domain of unknown function (DUF4145)